MDAETLRFGFITVGGLVALALCVGPLLACRFYAAALVKDRAAAAGFWAALAAGGGSSSRPDSSPSPGVARDD